MHNVLNCFVIQSLVAAVSQQYGYQKTTYAAFEAITALSFPRRHEINFKIVFCKTCRFYSSEQKEEFHGVLSAETKRILSL